MTILKAIQELEALAGTQPVDPVRRVERVGRDNEPAENKVVLDLRADPDPHGMHRMSLAYRLECMGWPV